MPSWLIDTNVLLRSADPDSASYQIAVDAVALLLQRAEPCYVCPQVLIEFWAVATRPNVANGLQWDIAKALVEIPALQERFAFAAEQPAVFERWWELCKKYQPCGKRTHDIRLLAVALASGITHILSFNVADFPANAGVTITHPRDVR